MAESPTLRRCVIGFSVGGADVSRENLRRLFQRLDQRGFENFADTPGGGAVMSKGREYFLNVRPDLIQVVAAASVGFDPGSLHEHMGEIAWDALQILRPQSCQQVGVKVELVAVSPGQDAPAFIEQRMLSSAIASGFSRAVGMQRYPGLRFVYKGAFESVRDLRVEPLFTDPKSLYVLLDAQFGGETKMNLSDIKTKLGDVYREASGHVQRLVSELGKEAS